MTKHSYKNFAGYLLNFQENYRYFAFAYTGKHLDLYLNQFVSDQINMAQSVYGDQYAEMLRVFAKQVQLPDYCFQKAA